MDTPIVIINDEDPLHTTQFLTPSTSSGANLVIKYNPNNVLHAVKAWEGGVVVGGGGC